MKASGNIFRELADASETEVFQPLWEQSDVLIERIVSHGQRSAPGIWYEQDRHEWVLLLKGAAKLCWKDGSEIRGPVGKLRTQKRPPSLQGRPSIQRLLSLQLGVGVVQFVVACAGYAI